MQNSTLVVDGAPLAVAVTGWGVCEATRASNTSTPGPYVSNAVRLPWEQHAFLQEWQVQGGSDIQFNLDGPFFRRCDVQASEVHAAPVHPQQADGRGSRHRGNQGEGGSGVSGTPSFPSPCGWGVQLPVDREHFVRSLLGEPTTGLTVMVVADTHTEAVVASAIWVQSTANTTAGLNVTLNDTSLGFSAQAVVSPNGTTIIRQAVAVAANTTAAVNNLVLLVLGFDASWTAACTLMEQRWWDAFNSTATRSSSAGVGASGAHFSGSLPSLQSTEPDLDRLFYWSTLALVQLERTNLLSFPRGFVISEGPSNAFDGSSDMGGTGQFVWDLSFSSAIMSLLEPAATRRLVQFLVSASNLTASPVAIPQAWDAYEDNNVGIGVYCFDFMAAFFLIQQYVSLTNDTGVLFEPVVNLVTPNTSATPMEFLGKLAWAWKSYPPSQVSPYLVDYGADKRDFLEVVPTYTSVVPALQLGNAGMLLALANLTESLLGPSSEVEAMRGNGTAIAQAVVANQYIDGTGYWRCLYNNETTPSAPVRSLADFMYAGQAMGVTAGNATAFLPASLRQEAVAFFQNELLANGWVRALSLSDPVMENVNSLNPGVEDKVAMRSDWTGTGGYGGLAGVALDALADLEQGFDAMYAALLNISLAAHTTMPAQGVAVMSPPFMVQFLNNNNGLPPPVGPFAPNFPEFFDEAGWPPFWPSTSRSVQNAEGSIADAIIRSLFGWRPAWVSPAASKANASAAIDAALFLPSAPRGGPGFKALLSGLRTPYGLIDITASNSGLQWTWSST